MSGSLSNYQPTIREAEEAYLMVTSYLKNFQVLFFGAIGSFGRSCYASHPDKDRRFGDLDIVVLDPEGQEDVRGAIGRLFGYHKNGNPKSQGLIGRIQVDVWVTADKSEYACTKLFFLLPRTLQISVRAIAAARGLKFSCKGLFLRETNERLRTETSGEIYEAIGIQPFTPAELIEAESYKGEEF